MVIFSVDRSVCDIAEYFCIRLQFCRTRRIILAVNYSNETSLLTASFTLWHGFSSLSLCCQAETVLHLRAQQLIGHHGVEPHRATNRRADCWLPHQPGESHREDRPLQSWDRYVSPELPTSTSSLATDDKQRPTVGKLWNRLMLPGNQWWIYYLSVKKGNSPDCKVINICILDSLVKLSRYRTWPST